MHDELFHCMSSEQFLVHSCVIFCDRSVVSSGHSAETLAFNFDALCGLVPPTRAPGLVVQHPALLACSPFTLWSHLHALGLLMGCDAQEAARLAGRHPRLLTASTQALRSRWGSI